MTFDQILFAFISWEFAICVIVWWATFVYCIREWFSEDTQQHQLFQPIMFVLSTLNSIFVLLLLKL